jgi:hypothetical protein
MAEVLTHAFVSAKSQSPDTTLVSKNEWNDGHVFGGGVNGQHIVYDDTVDNNIRWTDGVAVSNNSQTIGVTASPATGLASASFTANTSSLLIVSTLVQSYVGSGAAAMVLTVLINAATLATYNIASGDTNVTLIASGLIAAGGYTVSATITTAGGVNITSATVSIQTIRVGA